MVSYAKKLSQYKKLVDKDDKLNFLNELKRKRQLAQGKKNKQRLTMLIHRIERDINKTKKIKYKTEHWRYGGFRSSQELMWATTFEVLGIPYTYEDESFWLANGQEYLPDFHIPWGWVEVKDRKVRDCELEKARLLSLATHEPVAIVPRKLGPDTAFQVWNEGYESSEYFNGKQFQPGRPVYQSVALKTAVDYVRNTFGLASRKRLKKYLDGSPDKLKKEYYPVWKATQHNAEQGWVDYRGEVDAHGRPLKQK